LREKKKWPFVFFCYLVLDLGGGEKKEPGFFFGFFFWPSFRGPPGAWGAAPKKKGPCWGFLFFFPLGATKKRGGGKTFFLKKPPPRLARWKFFFSGGGGGRFGNQKTLVGGEPKIFPLFFWGPFFKNPQPLNRGGRGLGPFFAVWRLPKPKIAPPPLFGRPPKKQKNVWGGFFSDFFLPKVGLIKNPILIGWVFTGKKRDFVPPPGPKKRPRGPTGGGF